MPNAEQKAETIQQYATSAGDTGSTTVQVALLTERINNLSRHLATNKRTSTASVVCSCSTASAAVC